VVLSAEYQERCALDAESRKQEAGSRKQEAGSRKQEAGRITTIASKTGMSLFLHIPLQDPQGLPRTRFKALYEKR
jgi:hypothetical protein